MAFNYPRLRSEFWDRLGFYEIEPFWLDFGQIVDRGASGKAFISQYGTPKWRSKLTLPPKYHANATVAAGLIAGLRGYGTFHAYDPSKAYPASDPDGSRISRSTVHVRTIGSDNVSLSLKDMRNFFKLTTGDMMSIAWGDNEHHLATICDDITSNGSGNTDEFPIDNPLPSGVAVDCEVTLIRAYTKFRITPNSIQRGGASRNITEPLSFEIEEA